MNYRHAYHAGNFADVLKHAVVSLIVGRLTEKDRPFWVLDTHAGTGLYDLASEAARKTGEHERGIVRVLAAPGAPAALARYLALVRDLNGDRWPQLARYPGSPRIVRALLRPGDRLVANELHPDDAAALAEQFRGDRQVKVQQLDGYLAWKAFLPPVERRGLVLVDPPFEEPGEFERLAAGLQAAVRRWATGIHALWYPVKEVAAVRAFHGDLVDAGIRRILLAELLVRRPDDPARLSGCGMAMVNPPWRLAEALEPVLRWLARVLSQGSGAGGRVEWLVPE